MRASLQVPAPRFRPSQIASDMRTQVSRYRSTRTHYPYVNAAAEVWNGAMKDVISAYRATTPKRSLANSSGKHQKADENPINIGGLMVGAAGLEPATLSFEG